MLLCTRQQAIRAATPYTAATFCTRAMAGKVRRSVLYSPASNPKALEKGKIVPADVLIFDLEDAVAPEAKVEARRLAVSAASSGEYGYRELVIRGNGRGTEWFEADIDAAAASGAHALLLPKTESVADVRAIEERALRAAAREDLAIWCMIETPLGVLRANEIVTASPRLDCIVVGTVDLANELNCAAAAPERWNMMYALQHCALAARAAGVSAIDGVHTDLRDSQGFEATCRQGRDMGFDGKQLIHPKTIAVANSIFAPTLGEVAHAREIIAVYDKAHAEGRGVAVLHGKLIEALHVRGAERVLSMHALCEARLNAAAC